MLYFILLLLAFMPNLASAADLFTPVATDKSMQLLGAIFGKLGVFGASSSDPFIAVFGSFNAVILTIGGVLASYTILAGTLGTAHDGEMLGKKFSSVWLPIRTALGTALVLPVIGGGYCVMQLIVGWLVVQGIGLADTTWSTYMSANNVSQVVVTGMEKPAVNELAWNAFSSLSCMRGYEKIYKDSQTRSNGIWSDVDFGITRETNGNSTILKFGAKKESMGFFNDSCGVLTITKQDPLPSSLGTGEFSMIGDTSFLNSELSQADNNHLIAVEALVNSIDEAAIEFANNPKADVSSRVRNASAAYQTSTKEAAAGIVSKLGDFKQLEKSANKDGWILAGSYYMRLTYLSEVAQKAIAKTPSATGISGSVNNLFKDQFQGNYIKALQELKERSDGEFGIAGSENQSNYATDGAEGVWDWVKSGFGFEKLIKKIFKADAMVSASSNEHPIMAMKRIGNWAGITAGAMFVKYGLAMGAVGVAQGSGTAIAIATLPIAMIVFPSLMIISFMLSYVLPMMPFLIFIGIALGWVVLVVEAIVAAPLWAVMHLTANGDDMTGSGSQGYKLVLSLMLRPVLMIFGLIASLTIITVFGQLINMVFFDVFILSQQDSNIVIWLVGLIAAPLIYCGVMWTVIKKSLDVIHIIPDQILSWFGGGGQALGSYGNSIGGQGSNTYAAVNSLSHMGSGALNGSNGGSGGPAGALKGDDKIGSKLGAIASKNDSVSSSSEAPKMEDINTSISQKAMNQAGVSAESLEGQKMSSKIDSAIHSLGGADSQESTEFNSAMNSSLDGGANFNTAFKKNIEPMLDKKFGSGAGNLVSQSTEGKFEGDGFSKSVGQLEQVSKHYESKGFQGEEVKEKTSKLLNVASNNFSKSSGSIANGGDKDINHYVDKALTFSQEKDLKK